MSYEEERSVVYPMRGVVYPRRGMWKQGMYLFILGEGVWSCISEFAALVSGVSLCVY